MSGMIIKPPRASYYKKLELPMVSWFRAFTRLY